MILPRLTSVSLANDDWAKERGTAFRLRHHASITPCCQELFLSIFWFEKRKKRPFLLIYELPGEIDFIVDTVESWNSVG